MLVNLDTGKAVKKPPVETNFSSVSKELPNKATADIETPAHSVYPYMLPPLEEGTKLFGFCWGNWPDMAHSLEKFRILGLLTVKDGRYVEEDPQVVRPRMPDIQNTSEIPNYLSTTFSMVYNVHIATTGRYGIYYDPAEYHRVQKYTIYDIKHGNIPL